MLLWFDHNLALYITVFCIVLAASALLALQRISGIRTEARDARSDWRWGLVILLLLIAGRWPSLFVTRQFNTDEGLQIAGAITLRADPLFWRSVFGTTTGPLDFYVLLPMGTMFGADSYFSARLTGLLLITGALLFAHQALAVTFGRTVARISTFSAICFEAFSPHPEFIHYSTELLPLMLLSAAFYFAVTLQDAKPSVWPLRAFITGALLGAIPFAKLQAAPMAALGGLILVFSELVSQYQRKDVLIRTAILIAGALLPLAVFSVMLLLTDDRAGAWVSFISANVAYVENGFGSVPDTFGKIYAVLLRDSNLFLPWLAGMGLAGLVLLPWMRNVDRRRRNFALLALGWLVLSAVCIAVPRRPFLHYLQLSVIPLTLVFGAAVGIARLRLAQARDSTRKLVLSAAFVLPVASIFLNGGITPNPFIDHLDLYRRSPAGTVATAIADYASPGEALGLWGWNARYYVETGMRQATRHAMTDMEILINPYSDFFRSRYAQDLARTMPPVFVDASVVPGHYENPEMGHEISHPEVGDLIRSNYELIHTIDGVRIFVRHDRLAERRSPLGQAH